MPRDQAFYEMMESLFEMARYIALFDNTLYTYYDQKLYATEVYALNEIEQHSGINMTQLAKLAHRTKGAISQMITKLEKRGLVQKIVSPNNKSEYLLHLTPEGKAICQRHREVKMTIIHRYLNNMNDFADEDFSNTYRMLNRLRQITINEAAER